MTSLLTAHGAAWMTDAWYRRAWFVAPSAALLSIACLWLGVLDRPVQPPPSSGWVHPIDRGADNKALAALRDRAKTEPDAETLLRQRADHGSAIAQFYMATLTDPMIERSRATLERTTEAFGWYRKAADQGISQAQGNLGNLLAHDSPGHLADYDEAYKWLERSAASLPMGQRELGQLFRLGRGVPVDPAKGMDLIHKAADRGDPVAEVLIAEALDRGTDGLSQDHHEAVLLFQKAAMQNNIIAERALGIHLLKGEGIEADFAKATYWFKRAAAAGDSYAKAQLAAPGGAAHAVDGAVTPFSFAPIGR